MNTTTLKESKRPKHKGNKKEIHTYLSEFANINDFDFGCIGHVAFTLEDFKKNAVVKTAIFNGVNITVIENNLYGVVSNRDDEKLIGYQLAEPTGEMKAEFPYIYWLEDNYSIHPNVHPEGIVLHVIKIINYTYYVVIGQGENLNYSGSSHGCEGNPGGWVWKNYGHSHNGNHVHVRYGILDI